MTTSSSVNMEDSGARKTFETGAVRDIHEGKGRFDLMPLKSLSAFLEGDTVLYFLGRFQEEHDEDDLLRSFDEFCNLYDYNGNRYQHILKLAKHFENGALKYGERNWEKGISEESYLDSACRHYCKYRAGWDDEDHASAFLWNVLCLYHTVTVLNKNK